MRNSCSRTTTNRLLLLTPREREVLNWLVLGVSNRQIGAALNISSRTIEKHVERILAKLRLKNRTLAAAVWSKVRRDTTRT